MPSATPAQRVQVVSLVVLASIAAGAALYWLRPVMIPFVLAIFFAEILSPLVDLQTTRLKLPRAIAVMTTLLLGAALLGAVAVLVSISVGQLAANADAYQAKLARLLDDALAALPLQRFGTDPEAVLAPLYEAPAKTAGRLLLGTTNAILDLLSRGVIVLIFVLFLLFGGGGPRPATGVWWEIELQVKRYLVAKALISGATGLLVGAILSLLGVDLALVFGLFAFLLNFIPSIGSVIATLLPVPVVIASPELSTGAAIAAIAGPAAIQFVIGNVVEPRVMGQSLDLHPVVILMALIFWGMLWGIVGMLLATPLMAVMKILFGKFEATRALAELLAGRIAGLRAPA